MLLFLQRIYPFYSSSERQEKQSTSYRKAKEGSFLFLCASNPISPNNFTNSLLNSHTLRPCLGVFNLMSRPLEHDYIGLSEVHSMMNSDELSSSKTPNFTTDNVKSYLKTDLSLGLPGSDSTGFGVTLFGKELEGKPQNGLSNGSLKTYSLGAKRGFSDAIDCSEKWVLSINGRSETNLSKNGVLYSPKEVVLPSSPKTVLEKNPEISAASEHGNAPASKAQVVGWPPIRSFRKNTMATNSGKNNNDTEEKSVCLFVKVSMDGAPYLRKVDLQTYRNYLELSLALEKMFSCFITGKYRSQGHAKRDGMGKGESHSTDNENTTTSSSCEYVLTYEDKDGDWMLIGDVPWKMFTQNCRKLRIMKGSEAIGLGNKSLSQTPKCS